MLSDAVDHNYLTNMEIVVKCYCFWYHELRQKAAFIQELCMVFFVELINPDIENISDYLSQSWKT